MAAVVILDGYNSSVLSNPNCNGKEGVETLPRRLDKKERKEFDEMWDIPRNYVMACSNSVQLVPLQPIMISVLFHHYKELKECFNEVERIEGRRNYNSTDLNITNNRT